MRAARDRRWQILLNTLRVVWLRLGGYFLVALTVAVVSVGLFAELADEVLEQEVLSLNRQVMDVVVAWRSPAITRWALALTWLGSVQGILLLAGSFFLRLVSLRRWLDAIVLTVVIAGGAVLTVELKALFGQLRPNLWPHLASEISYSFPSGHALMSFCLFGFVAVWTVAQNPRRGWRWLVAGGCLLLAVLIALTRLYLGVHWPTDVLAGMLAALFWLAVCWAGERWLVRIRTPD